jgi:teichuronic acid biosynthesis glycosyltransferase TuaG
VKYKRKVKSNLNYESLIRSCDIGLSTVMMKKKLFNSYCKFPNLKTKEDYVLWLKLAKKKIALYGLNITLTQWRAKNNSLSANTIQKWLTARDERQCHLCGSLNNVEAKMIVRNFWN